MRGRLTSAVLVLGLLVGATGAEAASLKRGRQIVTRNCALCHAVGLRDSSRRREAPPFRDLNKRYPVEMLEEALAEGILTGHPEMPQFRFTPSEIDDIIAYLHSIQANKIDAPAGDPRAPSGRRPL